MTQDQDYLIENLAMLISSGMDIVSSLRVIREEIVVKKLRKQFEALEKEIDAGEPLWRAMEKTNFLTEPDRALIRIGEESGKLPENLVLIANQKRKDRSFSSKLRSALMYPVIVLGLTLVIGIGIAWFILPNLANVFRDLKLNLPLITKILIWVGMFLKNHGVVAVPIFFFIMGTIAYIVFFYKKTKFTGEYLLLHTPVIKDLIMQVELARLGYILGTLLESGLPILDALHSTGEATGMYYYRKFYKHIQDNISEGNSFQKSFETYKNSKKMIPSFVQQMISAGEKSGNLPETFLSVGKTYEEKTENTAKNLSVLLEPILLIIIWLGVVTVALAVILPIYSLIGGLNK